MPLPLAPRWTSETKDIRLDPEDLTLLAPESAGRRSRWERILSGRRPAEPAACGPADVVIAAGNGVAGIAEALALRLHRQVFTAEDAAQVLANGYRACGGSLLLVARHHELSHGFLERLLFHADAWDFQVGVVTGLDDAALAFMAAKLVTRPGGEGCDDWLILERHGDGGHLNESDGRPLVCGGIDAPVGQCDAMAACCRALGGAPFQLARDLPAERAALISCNSLALDGARVPAGLSVALAFADGCASAVLGISGYVGTDLAPGEASRLLGLGTRVGDCARALRAALTSTYGKPVALPLGDPLAGPRPSRPPSATVTAASDPVLSRDELMERRSRLRERLTGPLGPALATDPAELVDRLDSAGAGLAADGIEAVDRDVADLLMTSAARRGDRLLAAEIAAEPARKPGRSYCLSCGAVTDTISVEPRLGTELEMCALCGPLQVRADDDRVSAAPVAPFEAWRAGGMGRIVIGPRPGGICRAGYAYVGLRMNGSSRHSITRWETGKPLFLDQAIPSFLPEDTYYIYYSVASSYSFLYGRVRVRVY